MNVTRQVLAAFALVAALSGSSHAQVCGGEVPQPQFPAALHVRDGPEDYWPFRSMGSIRWDEEFPQENGWTVVREDDRGYFRDDETGDRIGPFVRVTSFARNGGQFAVGVHRDDAGQESSVFVDPDGTVEPFDGPCCGQMLNAEGDFLEPGTGSSTPPR
ncbi:MAG: hypothetical protein AB1758_00865 [Candidatus Eremiobacterota bacterium]